jgi:CspA family cold shock protein
MKNGVVRFYNRMRGWGFIVPDDLSDDVFVHHSAIVGRKYLREGQRVSYELGDRNGRVLARNVTVIQDTPSALLGGTQVDPLALLGNPPPKTAVR